MYIPQFLIDHSLTRDHPRRIQVVIVKKNHPIFPNHHVLKVVNFQGEKEEINLPMWILFLKLWEISQCLLFWPAKSSQRTRNLQANSYITRLLFVLQHHCLHLDDLFSAHRIFGGRQYCTQKTTKETPGLSKLQGNTPFVIGGQFSILHPLPFTKRLAVAATY